MVYFSGPTLTASALLPAPRSGTLPDFILDLAISTPICSLDTSASSALGVLGYNALHKSTYLLCLCVKVWYVAVDWRSDASL